MSKATLVSKAVSGLFSSRVVSAKHWQSVLSLLASALPQTHTHVPLVTRSRSHTLSLARVTFLCCCCLLTVVGERACVKNQTLTLASRVAVIMLTAAANSSSSSSNDVDSASSRQIDVVQLSTATRRKQKLSVKQLMHSIKRKTSINTIH